MTPDDLDRLLAAASLGRIEWDEPGNWLGISARIHPAGSGDVVAQVSMSGWGKRKGRAICEALVAAHNLAPALLRLWRAARAFVDKQGELERMRVDDALSELENHQ